MGNYNRDGGDRNNRGGGSRGGFGGGNRPPAVMHQATCNECNKSCEVPFRPSGDKPVYCKDCFASKGGGEKRFHDDRFPRKDFGDNRGPRPSFDNKRRPDQSRPSSGGDDMKRLLENMNTKIERLINSVENLAHMKFGGAKETPKAAQPAVVVPARQVAAPVKVAVTPAKAEVASKPAKKEVRKVTAKKGKK